LVVTRATACVPRMAALALRGLGFVCARRKVQEHLCQPPTSEA
jgi:hypothetical protein